MSRPQPKLEQVASPLVPRSELAASDIAIYTTRPSESIILRFLDHVRMTGMPETFPTICRTPPPDGSPPRFLRRIDVDRKLRPDGDLAPCAICSPFSPTLELVRSDGVIGLKLRGRSLSYRKPPTRNLPLWATTGVCERMLPRP